MENIFVFMYHMVVGIIKEPMSLFKNILAAKSLFGRVLKPTSTVLGVLVCLSLPVPGFGFIFFAIYLSIFYMHGASVRQFEVAQEIARKRSLNVDATIDGNVSVMLDMTARKILLHHRWEGTWLFEFRQIKEVTAEWDANPYGHTSNARLKFIFDDLEVPCITVGVGSAELAEHWMAKFKVLFGRERAAAAKPALAHHQARYCTACGEGIAKAAAFCSACGTRIAI